MELLVINDKYDENTLQFMSKYNIRFPKEGQIVQLLRVLKFPKLKKVGLVVAPYQEQMIPGKAYGLDIEIEMSFDKNRFVTLNKLELTDELLNDFKEEQKAEQKGQLVKQLDKNNYLNN